MSTLFIGVKNVPKADGENISTAISNLMTERFQETWKEKLVAMGTDGASVMLGKTSGVVKRIKDMTSRPVYAIHCSAHRYSYNFLYIICACIFTIYIYIVIMLMPCLVWQVSTINVQTYDIKKKM